MGRKAVLGMMLTLLLIGMLTMAFSIQPTEADKEPQLILDTDKDIYILGENVTITLTNIGSETVEIGGYPAWTISTYPREEPVYPNVFAWLAWSLEPGENDTFTWNQYNEFTQSPAEPGMYVIKDTQGWGLSTYFKIIAAEKIVPDDYPTIQEAINNANEGDTIYVRAGTYHEHVTIDKSLTLTGENRSTTIIDGNGTGSPICITANSVTISGFKIRNSKFEYLYAGIRVDGSDYNNITGNTLVDNFDGIFLTYSANNTICNNIVINNDWNGIHLKYDSNYNVISSNTILNNRNGINVEANSNDNYMLNNHIADSEWDGIDLKGSQKNNIKGNTITNCFTGIYLGSETDNMNVIYHNNFINNMYQVTCYSAPNFWDDGYPSGGNYWSDYAGVDLYSGPFQNETGSDGIGDTPYIIDGNNQDRYPLMWPEAQWVPYVPDPRGVDLTFWTANQDAYVNVTITFGDPCVYISDWGTVTKAGYDIRVDSEIWDWTGYCILVIWSVSHTYELGYLEIGNYTFTFKAWGNDIKSIDFTVTEVTPEFPPAIILPLFMILSIIAVIFAKRRMPRKPKN